MKNVLLCEDDDEIIELTAIILRLSGYRLSVLKKCDHDIVQRVRILQPDLVLMDLWIPDIGGENAIIQLKNDEHTKSIPVIVFSASNKAEEVAERVKAQGCITKPFAVNMLEEKISELFRRA